MFDFRSDLEVAFLRYDDVKVGAIVSVSIEEKMSGELYSVLPCKLHFKLSR